MGRLGMDDKQLRDEMLAAFLAIEEHDAHVVARREFKRGEVAPLVRQSVAEQRARFHATGNPESPAPRRQRPVARQVDNPMLTDGLAYSGQRNAHMRVTVEENAMTRIGALVFIRKREDYHERAAEEFKSLYEARYGGQGGAMDPGRVQVDTSPIAHDSGMAAKIDRTTKIKIAEDALGKVSFNRLVACVVLGIPFSEMAPVSPTGRPNDRFVAKHASMLLEDLEALAELWGYASRKVA